MTAPDGSARSGTGGECSGTRDASSGEARTASSSGPRTRRARATRATEAPGGAHELRPCAGPELQLPSDSGSGGIGIVLPIILGALAARRRSSFAVVRRRRRAQDRPRVSAMNRARGVAPRLVLAMTLAVAAAVALLAPAEAGAKRGITTGMAVPEAHLPDAVGARSLARPNSRGKRRAGPDRRGWRSVVGSQRPGESRDPSDPAYDFSRLDAAVRGAEQRGLKVLFTVYRRAGLGRGPEPPGGPQSGWRLEARIPGEFGALRQRAGEAVLGELLSGCRSNRRSRGSATSRPGTSRTWRDFFAPQWVGDQAEGPAIYRGLLNSFYDAVKAVDPGNVVMSGGHRTVRRPARRRRGPGRSVFLRELFCLEGRKQLAAATGMPAGEDGRTRPPPDQPSSTRPPTARSTPTTLRSRTSTG